MHTVLEICRAAMREITPFLLPALMVTIGGWVFFDMCRDTVRDIRAWWSR